MKLLFKLIIVALLGNAAYRIGSEYLTYVRFRDSIREVAMFKARDDDELRARIRSLSDEYDIPLDDDAVTIEREDRHVSIEGKYVKVIELVPNWPYEWPFSLDMDVVTSTLLPPPPTRR
jgi:hypothetical protein